MLNEKLFLWHEKHKQQSNYFPLCKVGDNQPAAFHRRFVDDNKVQRKSEIKGLLLGTELKYK